jgi:hypothetical protein
MVARRMETMDGEIVRKGVRKIYIAPRFGMKLIRHYLVYDNRNRLLGSIPPEVFSKGTRAEISASFLRELSYYARQRMLPLRFIQVDALGEQREVQHD